MRSTMRFCGAFRGPQELSCPEDRPETHRPPGESVGTALLAVDDAHRGLHLQARVAQRLDRLQQGAAGGDDVLDEAHRLALLERPLEPVAGSVLLRLLANDQEREPRLERRGRCERNRAELRRSEARRDRGVLDNLGGDPLAECAQEVGPRLEAVLVEVVPGAPARTQDEIALEIGVLEKRGAKLLVRHARAAASAARAIVSASTDSGEPSTSVSIVPSSK